MTQGAGQGPEVRTATLRRLPGARVRGVHAARSGAVPAPAPAPCPTASTTRRGSAGAAARGLHPDRAGPAGGHPQDRSDDRRSTLGDRPAAEPTTRGPGPLYVVGDVHGYLDELVAALAAQGLIDAEGSWCAGNARLWFLGDFTDRGPDGIGVIDLVMRLSAEAAAAGGYCKALMGNHELLLLGAKRFGDTPVNSGAGTATFQAAWLLNGGQKTDMDRLQDLHLQWMARLDAVVEEDGHLLVHSDTTAYLDYGDSIEDVNDTVHEILTAQRRGRVLGPVPQVHQALRLPRRGRPRGRARTARHLRRQPHRPRPQPHPVSAGRSRLRGRRGRRAARRSSGPHVYADGLAIAMDGGVTMAGKLLVVQLPLAPERDAGRRIGRRPTGAEHFRKPPVTPCRDALYHRLIRSRLSSVSARLPGQRRATRPYGASGDAHEQRSAPADRGPPGIRADPRRGAAHRARPSGSRRASDSGSTPNSCAPWRSTPRPLITAARPPNTSTT